MKTALIPPDKQYIYFFTHLLFPGIARGFLCPGLILVSTCSPVVLSTLSRTRARRQMLQPQSWRLVQGYRNERTAATLGQELTLVSVRLSLRPVKSLFKERII